jgi:hypothetical protein
MLKLLQIDNEENVQVCVRIIIELHKQYRPAFNPEVPDIYFPHCLVPLIAQVLGLIGLLQNVQFMWLEIKKCWDPDIGLEACFPNI